MYCPECGTQMEFIQQKADVGCTLSYYRCPNVSCGKDWEVKEYPSGRVSLHEVNKDLKGGENDG